MMHNSVCITSVNFILRGPVVQEKMVKTHREGKKKFGALLINSLEVYAWFLTFLCIVKGIDMSAWWKNNIHDSHISIM